MGVDNNNDPSNSGKGRNRVTTLLQSIADGAADATAANSTASDVCH